MSAFTLEIKKRVDNINELSVKTSWSMINLSESIQELTPLIKSPQSQMELVLSLERIEDKIKGMILILDAINNEYKNIIKKSKTNS